MLIGYKEPAAVLQAIEGKGRAALQEASYSHCQAAKIYFWKAYQFGAEELKDVDPIIKLLFFTNLANK